MVSAITFVTAGLNKPEYKHIFSFRRQAYINFEENSELPQSLIINFNQFAFRIFLSTDEIKCFMCKKTGHIANKCPNVTNKCPNVTNIGDITIADVHQQPMKGKNVVVESPTNVGENNPAEIITNPPVENPTATQSNIDIDTTTSKKRPASSSVEWDKISVMSNESDNAGEENNCTVFVKPRPFLLNLP
ncbi:Zinc knuckle [Popillia japonica]|uniref:Zinc knuckle n=1 Tax=Popillia japonica TaxID=7064 RepID=A0AAW1J0D7_POPJA